MSIDNRLDTRKAYLLTESRVDRKISIESLLNLLRVQKMTAHVNIQVIQGGIHEVIVTEKVKVDVEKEVSDIGHTVP